MEETRGDAAAENAVAAAAAASSDAANPISGSPPSEPGVAAAALLPPPTLDDRRRCFICLTDEEDSDPPGMWVEPCPCELDSHQECLRDWLAATERDSKTLKCPMCKYPLKFEGSWNPIVGAMNVIQRGFSRVSPMLLMTGITVGTQFSLQLYGSLALWTFAGKDFFLRFMLEPDMALPAARVFSLSLARARVWRALALLNVAPALLFGRLLPGTSNKFFFPAASLYTAYHMRYDDDFVSWPPSPRLALAVFPYVRSIYLNLWRTFALAPEIRFQRQLLGLPPIEERPQGPDQANDEAEQDNAEGGALWMMQGMLNFLLAQGPGNGNLGIVQLGGAVMEIEVRNDGNADDDEAVGPAAAANPEDAVAMIGQEQQQQGQQQPAHNNDDDDGNDGEAGAAGAAAGQDDAAGDAANADQAAQVAEEPVRNIEVGIFLSAMSDAVVGTLLLPGISLAMGEALRLVLPRTWTRASPQQLRSQLGTTRRPGLLQQQWGRSLVGGCLFVVLRDVLKLYANWRRVVALQTRRVRNVDRPRRRRGAG